MKMIDRTGYSQRDTERKPRILEFIDENTGRSFKVHRHVEYPGTWLFSDKLVERRDLKTDDLDKAIVKAFIYARNRISREIEELTLFLVEVEESLAKMEEAEDEQRI